MILHVACLPFPSPQGTQAAIDAMLRASAAEGHPAHLLTYAHGAADHDGPYEIHRIPDFPRVRSLRSGPSWGKVALDLRCIGQVRALTRRLRPAAVVAHHIEAALACVAAGVKPLYYVAHTSLERELPVYFPRLPPSAIHFAGRSAERWVCQQVDGVGAVAPSLTAMLGAEARHLPIPWAPAAPAMTRREARTELGLPLDATLCLYAGNLDHYQGWEHLMGALACLRRQRPVARLLIATASDPRPALAEAIRAGVAASVELRGLAGERARTLTHAASDLAWIPRRTEGGLPIKMLDAFARGLPVIAMERATAGLHTGSACVRVRNDDPKALAEATSRLLEDPTRAETLRREGAAYLAEHHSNRAFASALRSLLAQPPTTPADPARATPAEPPRSNGRALQAR
jgi:glycosyltransferase involved in cell wall biosynthesis